MSQCPRHRTTFTCKLQHGSTKGWRGAPTVRLVRRSRSCGCVMARCWAFFFVVICVSQSQTWPFCPVNLLQEQRLAAVNELRCEFWQISFFDGTALLYFINQTSGKKLCYGMALRASACSCRVLQTPEPIRLPYSSPVDSCKPLDQSDCIKRNFFLRV